MVSLIVVIEIDKMIVIVVRAIAVEIVRVVVSVRSVALMDYRS